MAPAQRHFIDDSGVHVVRDYASSDQALTDPTPAGWRAVSPPASPYDTWDGTKWVSGSAPTPDPADFPLTARQLRLGLIRHGVSLATVQNAINRIADEQARDEAQVYWDFSGVIEWSHPTTQQLLAVSGISVANAKVMWMAAKDYER